MAEESIDERLQADFDFAKASAESILRDSPNYRILDPDYLTPTGSAASDEVLGWSDPDGAFMYFSGLRDALYWAKARGTIPKDLAPVRAPDYVSDLVKE